MSFPVFFVTHVGRTRSATDVMKYEAFIMESAIHMFSFGVCVCVCRGYHAMLECKGFMGLPGRLTHQL